MSLRLLSSLRSRVHISRSINSRRYISSSSPESNPSADSSASAVSGTSNPTEPSSKSEQDELESSIRSDLTSRPIGITRSVLDPTPSHLLNLMLTDLLPPSCHAPPVAFFDPDYHNVHELAPQSLPQEHHLAYFPPAVPGSALLPDGTDTLHSPGPPFGRRLWAGGSLYFRDRKSFELTRMTPSVCHECIKDVRVKKGEQGDERVFVHIHRGYLRLSISKTKRGRASEMGEVKNHAFYDHDWAMLETRDLVFLKEKTREQALVDAQKKGRVVKSPLVPDWSTTLTPTPDVLFRWSALTYNAHRIHLDPQYCREVEGHRDLLVHGPLSLTLMLASLRSQFSVQGEMIKEMRYKNLAALYVNEEMKICIKLRKKKVMEKIKDEESANTPATPADSKAVDQERTYDIWIEGPEGGLAVKGVATIVTGREFKPVLPQAFDSINRGESRTIQSPRKKEVDTETSTMVEARYSYFKPKLEYASGSIHRRERRAIRSHREKDIGTDTATTAEPRDTKPNLPFNPESLTRRRDVEYGFRADLENSNYRPSFFMKGKAQERRQWEVEAAKDDDEDSSSEPYRPTEQFINILRDEEESGSNLSSEPEPELPRKRKSPRMKENERQAKKADAKREERMEKRAARIERNGTSPRKDQYLSSEYKRLDEQSLNILREEADLDRMSINEARRKFIEKKEYSLHLSERSDEQPINGREESDGRPRSKYEYPEEAFDEEMRLCLLQKREEEENERLRRRKAKYRSLAPAEKRERRYTKQLYVNTIGVEDEKRVGERADGENDWSYERGEAVDDGAGEEGGFKKRGGGRKKAMGREGKFDRSDKKERRSKSKNWLRDAKWL